MERITKSQYLAIPKAYRGTFEDVRGDHPEWKGRRTAFLPGHGTVLFIEGVSFEIVDDVKHYAVCISDADGGSGEMKCTAKNKKAIWNSFPKDGKPEWLTMRQIEKYERKMVQ